MLSLPKLIKRASSRRQIEIKGAKDDVLLLPRNQYRIILEVSAVNFELKSEAEQDALVETYQAFLNSLPCSLELLVRVREVDVDRYLEDFAVRQTTELEPIYKQQIQNYTEFVKSLVATNKILSRHFYIVIPHSADTTDFSLVKEQLALTQDIVCKGLSRLGMQARRINNLELLDLFYRFYNEPHVKIQPLTEQAIKELLEKAVL